MQTTRADIESQLASGANSIPVIQELEPLGKISPQSFFAQIARLYPQAFYFQRQIRFDKPSGVAFIGLDPFETITVRAGRAEIAVAGEKTKVSPQPPLAAIQERLNQHRAIPHPIFPGGAFGYFSYDFIRHLEPRLKKSGYFRELDAQNSLDAEFMLFQKILCFDLENGEAHAVFALTFENSQPDSETIQRLHQTAQEELTQLKTLYTQARSAAAKTPPTKTLSTEIEFNDLEASLDADAFFAGVKKLKEHIRAGDIFQAVLSDRLTLKAEIDPHTMFAALKNISPAPYQFHMQMGTRHFLGASPEMLVRYENEKLETHPIAGTRPRGKDEAEDRRLAAQLRRSPKERAEHLMLVDLARNDLGRVAEAGTVRVEEFQKLKRFDTLMHLVSRVSARKRPEISSLEALGSCFPAGTLSGAPKIRAMELIAEIERAPRGFYGGAVIAAGFDGQLDSCISIRSVQIDTAETEKANIVLQAGAGIVADSTAAREYDEIRHKTHTLRRALAAALHPSNRKNSPSGVAR